MPYLAMQFSSPIQRVQWVGGRYVVAYAENDTEVQLFDTETERVTRFRNDAGGSSKNGALDPLGKYFAITSCDGFLSVFTVPGPDEETNIGQFVKRIKISKANIQSFGDNPFEASWTPDGSALFVSGENSLGIIARDTWELNLSKDFAHKKPITCITWLTDTVFATAGLDDLVKIWNYPGKYLLHYISSLNHILQISYCQRVSH